VVRFASKLYRSTRFSFLGNLFRRVNHDERLIRNVPLICQHLEFVEHFPRQADRDGLHRGLNAVIELDLDAVRLGKIETIRRVVGIPKLALVLVFPEFWHRLLIPLHKPIVPLIGEGRR
jgi:hypothetical protein